MPSNTILQKFVYATSISKLKKKKRGGDREREREILNNLQQTKFPP